MHIVLSLTSLAGATVAGGQSDSRWVRAGTDVDHPVWGLREGMMVGIWPGAIGGDGPGGPRGLIRVGYPLGQPRSPRLVNFLAVEPNVGDGEWRGLSELEMSALDGVRGKRFTAEAPPGTEEWSADKGWYPGFLDHPQETPDVERLRVCIRVERFDNGAHPYLVLTLRSDRPDEVMVETFHEADSRPMRSCVLTATMGNYARLRRAYLGEGKVAVAGELWPGYQGEGFAPSRSFPLPQLARAADGSVIVPMECDEDDPAANWPHDPGIWWRWPNEKITQYWREPAGSAGDSLEFVANGRAVYWASRGLTVPGGVAFENTELREPYRPGQAVVFGVTRRSAQNLLQG